MRDRIWAHARFNEINEKNIEDFNEEEANIIRTGYMINRKVHVCFDIPDSFLVLNMIIIYVTRSLRSLARYHIQPRNKSGIAAAIFFP